MIPQISIVQPYKDTTNQFCELIENIRYGCKLVKSGKWTYDKYYNYMADFFDYIDLPDDAKEHRSMAKEWLSGVPIGLILKKYNPPPTLAEIRKI